MKFYMFHVENPVEVVTGTEMANLTEKGPYVYRVRVEQLMIQCLIQSVQLLSAI